MATKRLTLTSDKTETVDTPVLGSTDNTLTLISEPTKAPEAAGPQYEAYLESETPGGAVYRYRHKQ